MARPRQVSDEQIAQAARETFLKHGAGAAVSLIARSLDISQAALFHRAQSKKELLLRALRPHLPKEVAILAAGPGAGPIRPQLSATLLGLLTYLTEVVPCISVLRGAGLPVDQTQAVGEPPTVALRRLLTGWLSQAAERGQTQLAVASVIAEALLGALEARAFNRYVGGDSFTPGTDEDFVHQLVLGLVPEAATP